MFKFLREKLRQGISSLGKKIEEEGKEEIVELPAEAPPEEPKKKGFLGRMFGRKEEIKAQEQAQEEISGEASSGQPSETLVSQPIHEDEVKEEIPSVEERSPAPAEPSPASAPAPKEPEVKGQEEAREAHPGEAPREQAQETEKPVQEEQGAGFSIDDSSLSEEVSAVPEEEKEQLREKMLTEEQGTEVETPDFETGVEGKEQGAEEEGQPQEMSQEENSGQPGELPVSQPSEESHEDTIEQESSSATASSPAPAEPAVNPEEQKDGEQTDTQEAQERRPSEGVAPEEKAPEAPPQETQEEAKEGKRGFFAKLKEKVVTKKISAQQFEGLFWELEVALLENNVAVSVIEKMKEDLKQKLVDTPIRRNRIEESILLALRDSVSLILGSPGVDIMQRMGQKKPFVICFVGINGSGKTTSIAKVGKMLLDRDKKIVLAAADTFRAAAIDQLQIHADRLGVKMIRHDYGSDPAAVAFDAVKYAEAKGLDAVLIDTAGRLHSNSNLVDEMKKIVRVAKPDLKIFVGESITGNDCVEQAEQFNEAIGIDGIILSKVDIDEKGGAALSVSYVTKKPILYLGTGQEYADLKAFDKEEMIGALGLEA